jgi:hypothetical protein
MPTTPVAVAIFLLMVFPGVVLELLRLRARPGRQESVFAESSRVLVGGVTVSAVTLLILGGLRSLPGSPLPDPRKLLIDRLYLPDHLWSTGFGVLLFLGMSSTMAALYFVLIPFKGLPGAIEQESAWVTVFARLAERARIENAAALRGKQLITCLRVDMEDGTGYAGIRESFSPDVALENRELVLSAPIQRVNADGEVLPPDEKWERVILSQDKISGIRVRFTTEDAAAEPPRARALHALAQRIPLALASPRWLIALLVVQVTVPAVITWMR